MILEVFSNLNDSLFLFFFGIQLLMGFHVVCRVFDEESNSCHCHGKGGEAGEPHMRTSPLQWGANSWPVWFTTRVLLRFMPKGMLLPERNCASLEFSLASVIHMTLKGCCDKFLHVQGQHETSWVSASSGAEWCLCCVYKVAERFQNE